MTLVRWTSAAARVAVAALVALALVPAAAQAASPPSVNAFFAQDATLPGTSVGLGFTIVNTDAASPLTGVAFSVALPAGLVIATPSQLQTTCDGTATAIPGGTAISLSGASLQLNGDEGDSCLVLADVVAASPGIVNVTAGGATSNESIQGPPSNTASLEVIALPTIAESFGAPSIAVGATTSLTYTLANPNAATPLYDMAFEDALPAGLRVTTPASVTGSCLDNTTGTVTAEPGGATIALVGQQVDAASQCSLSVAVTATAPTTSPNPTGPLSFSFEVGGGSRQAGTVPGTSATLIGVGPPALTAGFGASTIAPNATTTLTFALTNPNPSTALTGVGFTAPLPAGLVVAAPNGVAGSCGAGTITAAAGAGSIELAGGTLAAGAGCTFSVVVSGASDGRKTTTTSAVSSAQGGAGAAASASLFVASPPSIQAAFSTATMPLGANRTLTFTITNPNQTQSLSGLAFTDNLPSGLTITAPGGSTGTCGGTVAAGANDTRIALSGGTLAAQSSCTIAVGLDATSVGEKVNSTGPISSTEGGAGAAASSSITVEPAPERRLPSVVAPSNAFKLTKLRIAKDGTVRFDIKVPGTGDVSVVETIARKGAKKGSRLTLARKRVGAAKARTLHVTVRLTRTTRRALRRAGRRVPVKVSISFKPTGGKTRTVNRTVVFRR